MTAIAWAWLTRRLSELDDSPLRSINREWADLRRELDGRPAKGMSLTDWPSDFWVAKTERSYLGLIQPVWTIPERLDDWPTLSTEHLPIGALPSRGLSRSRRMPTPWPDAASVHALPEGDAARDFFELIEANQAPRDQADVSANQIRAWVAAAFGDLLGGIAFTPIDDDQTRAILAGEVVRRIGGIDSLPFNDSRLSFLDYGCEILYTTSVTEDGDLVRNIVRQGQSTNWQHHWMWLSVPQDANDMAATVKLAGRLLINETMLASLVVALQDENPHIRKRALCVVRRWLLTAKVLAWLFDAIEHSWHLVRPQDLACFAFAALSPAWPRRAVAISHRSGEAKPFMTGLRMWRSPHVAVDASYVPAWETNIGMIWNLFAPVPIVARVTSELYFESEWCGREHEMLQYLVDHADFLDGRMVVDIGADQLEQLDAALFDDAAAADAPTAMPLSAYRNEFPPMSMVLVGRVASSIDLALLRAAGALRLINALVGDPAMTNRIAEHVAAGGELAMEAPTNNPDGWAAYREIFQELESWRPELGERSIMERLRGGNAASSLMLTVPDDYSAQDRMEDLARASEIADLSDGQHRLADALVAVEWRRTVLEWFNNEGFGDKALVDVTGSSVEEWSTLPDFALARGLMALVSHTPIWIMQRAGQNAHLWPGFREQPIFTRHVTDQFAWLKPVNLHPSWLIYYLASSGLVIGADLEAALIASVVETAGLEAIEVTDTPEGPALTVPEPRDFMVIPEDDLQDVYALINALNEDNGESS